MRFHIDTKKQLQIVNDVSNDLGCHFFNPAGNYMFKVNKKNTRTKCEICSELTIKTPE